MNAQSLISYYNRANDFAPSGEITVVELCRKVRDGETAAAVAKVRAAQTEDEEKALKLRLLPAVQFSGYVTTGIRKQAFTEGRFIHSGWLQVDIDKGGLRGKTADEAKAQLASDPHVLCAFISPSGKGAKGLFRIPVCTSEDEHQSQFLAVQRYISETHQLDLDPAPKNSGSLCYVPSDSAITWNGNAVQFVAPAEVSPPPAPAAPATPPPTRKRGTPFPEPPEHGIHPWLATAAWHCRIHGMDESETVAKIESYDGKLRRRLTPNEARDAARTVFSQPWRESLTPPTQTAGEPDLTRFQNSDAGNAERFHAMHGANLRHVAESGSWLIWDGSRWQPDNDGAVIRLFISTMRKLAAQAVKLHDPQAAQELAKFALRCTNLEKVKSGLELSKSIQGVTVSVSQLDGDPWLVGTPGGAIDLRSGQPIRPERAMLITKSIGTDYHDGAECPLWLAFIETATCGDAELATYLQAAVGYTLTASVREQCLFFLHGCGQNGKGVFSETVKSLLGDYAQTAPESLFTKDRNTSATNDVARLSGCRLAIAAELEEGAAFAESRIKALTGGDSITARFLHHEFFDFSPTHKFWISGNHKPTVRGTDTGIWRRLRLLPFVAKIPDEAKDPALPEKLRAELPGILRWALAGCLSWQRHGLTTPACVKAATESYRQQEDIVGVFLDEAAELDDEARELQSTVFEGYKGWADKQGIRKPLSATMLNRKLEERGFEKIKVQGARYWRGISIP